jgi:hypothetical protein
MMLVGLTFAAYGCSSAGDHTTATTNTPGANADLAGTSSNDNNNNGDGNSDGGSSNGNGGGGDMECGGQEFALTRIPPNVMLVLDRSGSMSDAIASGSKTTKYADLTSAMKSLVSTYDAQMRLGATFFASDNNCGAGTPGAIAAANGQSILAAVAAHSPGGNTPTATTLDAVIQSKALTDATRANYVVLATDGEPNCGDTDVTSRITKLYGATPSVSTFVIGIGAATNTDPTLLNAWADAGHTARSGATHYYQTNSSADLMAAFDAIAGGIVSCDFQMTEAAPDPTLITVTENGTPVSPSPTVGYTYDPATNTVTLHGAACDALKNDASTKVSVVYGCPGPPPIS